MLVLSVATQMQTCKNKEKASEKTIINKSEQVIPVKQVVIDRSMTPIEKINALEIIKASISDSLLTVSFTYKGTSDDSFDLIFNGMYQKSLPMQANVKLKQYKAEGIESIQTKTLVFDVTPMKASGSELHIKVENFPDKLVFKY